MTSVPTLKVEEITTKPVGVSIVDDAQDAGASDGPGVFLVVFFGILGPFSVILVAVLLLMVKRRASKRTHADAERQGGRPPVAVQQKQARPQAGAPQAREGITDKGGAPWAAPSPRLAALKSLKELFDAGTLSQEEFDTEKKKILQGVRADASLSVRG